MSTSSKPFTVVLLRPDYLIEPGDYPDTYVALVHASDAYGAVWVAQQEVFDADKRDEMEPEKPDDYKLCNVFEGHCKALLWSWNL